MFSAKKITPAESQEHSINIDDFVSKPVNPLQLPDSIQRIFFRRNDIVLETLAPQNKGLDPAVIDEYCALRKNVEVVRNLQEILKVSSGVEFPVQGSP